MTWTVALIGGVGGTLTVLCYGYWIREEGRKGTEDLRMCRIDLGTGYAMTAVFGLAMVVIGSRLGQMSGSGATLIVEIAEKLQTVLGSAGPLAKWSFLIGAWGAVFSSLLGVWQSIPYLFAGLLVPDQAGPRRQGKLFRRYEVLAIQGVLVWARRGSRHRSDRVRLQDDYEGLRSRRLSVRSGTGTRPAHPQRPRQMGGGSAQELALNDGDLDRGDGVFHFSSAR